MDDPQNSPKPVDDLMKDLYGPSEDTPLETPPVDIPTESQPPQPPQSPTDYWPPVPPIVDTNNGQPPWIETPVTPVPASNEVPLPPVTSPIESNYPKPPIFQSESINEPVETETLSVSKPESEVLPEPLITGTMTPPPFTSPLPPRPEPEIIAPVLPVAPPPQTVDAGPRKKSKLLLLLPFVAVIAIGLAVLLFVKSKKPFTPSGPVNLTYWGLFEPNSVFQQVIADYEKANPTVKINYQQQSGLKEYRDRLTNAITKEGGPDIFRVHLSWIPMFTENLSVIPSSIYSSSQFNQDYYPSAILSLTAKNGIVGLPLYFDSLALFYNEDLFRAAGQNPPSTWEDLIKSACTLTVRDQNGRIKTGGVAIGSTSNVDHWSDILGLMLLQNDADPSTPDTCNDQGVCPGKDALTFFTSFVKNSACRNSEGAFLGSSWSDLLPSSTYAFATGQVAMYFAPSWRVFDIKNLNPNLNFKIVPVPQLTTEVKEKVAWATYWVESVSASSPNQAEAWKFLKYLSSKEILEKLYLAQTNLGNPRVFGEPYPRVEMASMLVNDPWVSPFITQASFAKSWYLSSFTSDNGINDGIIKYYEDAVNQAVSDTDSIEALKTVTQGVAQVLSRYGIRATTRQ